MSTFNNVSIVIVKREVDKHLLIVSVKHQITWISLWKKVKSSVPFKGNLSIITHIGYFKVFVALF